MENKAETEKKIENIISAFLESYSDIVKLFNHSSRTSEFYSFFTNNFNTIYNVMEKLFINSIDKKDTPQSQTHELLNFIECDFDDFNRGQKIKSYQRKMITATLIHLLVGKDLTIDDLPIEKALITHNDGKHWYRGQSDYQWNLTPSMFRNLRNVFPKETKINNKTIEQIYSESGMLDKWNQVFNSSIIDYSFLSYMQHSISYSPLLDFTSNFPTALSFALYNKSSINDYAYKDSSVFQIEVSYNQIRNRKNDLLPNSYYIDFIPDKYSIGASILGKPIHTYNDIIKALTPEFVMIDSENNDRMRYQKGRFIFFYNYLSIQGTICTWLNQDLHVTKYRIKKEDKNKWCELLRNNYPHLMVEKMMNPYSYFSDQ